MPGRSAAFALAASLALTSLAQASELSLLMIRQEGCGYCRQWDREVGPVYPKTAEGRAAPLQEADFHDPLPAGVTLARPPAFTPTFVLLADGAEMGRIEGYPGEAFFWGLLGRLIAENGHE
ncbi:hypothetical protein [Mangrovicoccus sp. HB161399]|uniref:hypothetical protein n=1 Tax=Mangrovicoccus sp. HB161399 TaxID=2720392 RepID=UPI0015567648|nr:hypothetical protein [Mangrovicoccus sp. HB161399]